MSDIALAFQDSYTIDLAIENGDLKKDDGLETAVLISLFTDKRVSEDERPDLAPSLRGFWGDLFPEVEGDQIGSKLWLLEREKRTQETLRRAEDYCEDALKWLIDDGIAESIEVTAEYDGTGVGAPMHIGINILKPSGRESRFTAVWDAQKIIRG